MKDDLTFARFQAANVRRCKEAFKHDLEGWSLLEWAGALAGEVGEAANLCKKIRRQEMNIGGTWAKRDPVEGEMRRMLKDEIGDCMAYLVLLAAAAGLDAGQCAADKFDKVSDKAGWNGERLKSALAPEPAAEPQRTGTMDCSSTSTEPYKPATEKPRMMQANPAPCPVLSCEHKVVHIRNKGCPEHDCIPYKGESDGKA